MFNPFNLLKKISGKEEYSKVSEFLSRAERVIKLSEEIEKKKKDLLEAEYKILSENKDDVFISLKDFMEIIESPNISMQEVLKKCHHGYEIGGKASTMVVDAYVEDNHLVFCIDKNSCEKHKDAVGNRINLITMRSK